MTRFVLAMLLPLLVATGARVARGADAALGVDVQPAAALVSPNIARLEARRSRDGTLRSERIEREVSALPTVRVGLDAGTEDARLRLMAGGGALWNEAFRALVLRADVGARIALGGRLALGPHVGWIYFGEPHWRGDADLDISDAHGVLGGLDVSVALGPRVGVLFSVDYLRAAYDVRGRDGWAVSEDEIDLSGVALQLGITGRF